FTSPDIYLLGSSGQSAVWAAEYGLPYVFADFIHPFGEELAANYRTEFKASSHSQQPWVAVCAWAICADTDEEAMQLSYSLRMAAINLARGLQSQVPTVKRAAEFLAKEGFPPETLPPGRRILTGSPHTLKAKLEQLVSRYQADELFVVSIIHDHAARRRSHELIAQAFEPAPR
ncbi:MAG: LLM class flavin-dependent oxidoreductase, partial [Chloroflexia bacterium]